MNQYDGLVGCKGRHRYDNCQNRPSETLPNAENSSGGSWVLCEFCGFGLGDLVVSEFAETLVACFDELLGGLVAQLVELGFDPLLEEGGGCFVVPVGSA